MTVAVIVLIVQVVLDARTLACEASRA